MPKWKKAEDKEVRHIFVADCSDPDCISMLDKVVCRTHITSVVDGGTPICPECEDDMAYSHTEVRVTDRLIEA